MAALQDISNYKPTGYVQTSEIYKMIESLLKTKKKVQVISMDPQSNISENESADQMAKVGLRTHP